MYGNGEGVTQDYIQAHTWWNISASQGNAGAAKNLDKVARYMTPVQIAEAQKLALASGKVMVMNANNVRSFATGGSLILSLVQEGLIT